MKVGGSNTGPFDQRLSNYGYVCCMLIVSAEDFEFNMNAISDI